MSENLKYWKFYPTLSANLGTTDADIFEGDYTPAVTESGVQGDRIIQNGSDGIQKIFYRALNGEWGRTVQKKVGGRIKSVWEPGVFVGPVTWTNPETQEEVQMPVWFCLKGDIKGVVVAKLPNGEEVEPVET